MDKDATAEKFKYDWGKQDVKYTTQKAKAYKLREVVGTITIPCMDIYELPTYNGSTDIDNNWQITTPGHLGNWSLFGEQGVSSVGAHNYQLLQKLPSLTAGDKILIETPVDRYVYVVESTDIYNHRTDSWSETAARHSQDSALNLMTCSPTDAAKTEDMHIVYTTLQKGTIF